MPDSENACFWTRMAHNICYISSSKDAWAIGALQSFVNIYETIFIKIKTRSVQPSWCASASNPEYFIKLKGLTVA